MSEFETLLSQLRSWQRWTRLHRAVYFGARGLVGGITLCAMICAFLIPAGSVLATTYGLLLGAAGILGFVIAVAIAWLWPQSQLRAARTYERVFDLKERISTAIELNRQDQGDRIWRGLQLNDALLASSHLDPRSGLQWVLPKKELALLLLTSVLVLGSWFYGQASFQQAESNRQNHDLIMDEIESLDQIMTGIENDAGLSAENKEALLSPLKELIDDLNQADSLEEAASVMRETQQTLEELSIPGREAFEGLQKAGQELAGNADSPLNAVGEALSQGDMLTASEALAALDLSRLNDESLANLAEELMQTSQQLESAAPEIAQHLQEAADAIESDDLEAAQEAVADTSKALSASIQQMELSKASGESAEELGKSQERLMQAAMLASAAEDGSAPSDPGESPAVAQAGSSGSLAGSGEYEAPDAPGREADLTPLTQDFPTATGTEKKYESVYAPQRIGADSGAELSLGGSQDADSTALGGIDSSFTQSAQSSVPYTEVFASYAAQSQQALESGMIPLSLQPLVRDYFSSLNPK